MRTEVLKRYCEDVLAAVEARGVSDLIEPTAEMVESCLLLCSQMRFACLRIAG